MAKFTKDTQPPGFDPELQEQHKFTQKPDPLIDGQPDTRQQLKPGDQYIGMLGELVTVLTPSAQAAQDARDREKRRAQAAAGLESEQRCLAHTKAEIVRWKQVAEDAWAAVQALKPLKPGDVNAQTIAVRNQTRIAWVWAVGAVEQHMETERAQVVGVATMRERLKDA